MPAPAVIPALVAYVKVVAVKTLVVVTRPSEACVRDWTAALITGHTQRLTRGDVGRMRLGLSRLRMGHRVLGLGGFGPSAQCLTLGAIHYD